MIDKKVQQQDFEQSLEEQIKQFFSKPDHRTILEQNYLMDEIEFIDKKLKPTVKVLSNQQDQQLLCMIIKTLGIMPKNPLKKQQQIEESSIQNQHELQTLYCMSEIQKLSNREIKCILGVNECLENFDVFSYFQSINHIKNGDILIAISYEFDAKAKIFNLSLKNSMIIQKDFYKIYSQLDANKKGTSKLQQGSLILRQKKIKNWKLGLDLICSSKMAISQTDHYAGCNQYFKKLKKRLKITEECQNKDNSNKQFIQNMSLELDPEKIRKFQDLQWSDQSLEKGIACQKESQNYSDAIQYYDHAIALNSQNIDALTAKGCAQFNLGLLEEALATLTQALQIDNKDKMAMKYYETVNQKVLEVQHQKQSAQSTQIKKATLQQEGIFDTNISLVFKKDKTGIDQYKKYVFE